MNQFDLIGVLKDYATAEDMAFLYGEQFMQNYEATQIDYINGQRILTAEFSCSPLYGQGNKINQITYNGVIGLGAKFDDDGTGGGNDGTPSSLDETKIQKYTRRLYDLMTELSIVIEDVACANELTINNVTFKMDVNKFDLNADFVFAEISFIQ